MELVVALAIVAVVVAIAYPQINLANSTAQDSQVKASMNAALTAAARTFATDSIIDASEPYYGGIRTPEPDVSAAAIRSVSPSVTVTENGTVPSANDQQVSVFTRFVDDGRFWRVGVAALASAPGSDPAAAGCWMAWRDLEPPVGAQSEVAAGPVLEAYFFLPPGADTPATCTGERASYAPIPDQALLTGSTLAANWNTPAFLDAAPTPTAPEGSDLTYPDTAFVQNYTPSGAGESQTLLPVSADSSIARFSLTEDLPTRADGTPAITFDTATGAFTSPAVWSYAFSSIDTNGNTTCGVSASRDQVACWGQGTPTAANPVAAQVVPGILEGTSGARPLQVSVGKGSAGSFGCVRYSDGRVRCFGDNSDGQLGNGSTTPSSTIANAPVWVNGLTDAVDISAGNAYACAARENGDVVCWGTSPTGALAGPSGPTQSLDPVTVPGISAPVQSVHASNYAQATSCAITSEGTAYCWGSNASGKAGQASTDPTVAPGPVVKYTDASATTTAEVNAVTDIAAGRSTTCAVIAQGVACWGDPASPLVSNIAAAGDPPALAAVNGYVDGLGVGSAVVSVHTGTEHACALSATGQVSCWGTDSAGELGRAQRTTSVTAQLVFNQNNSPLVDAAQLTVGNQTSCALLPSGDVTCWGFSADGATGFTTLTEKATVPPLSGLIRGFPFTTRVDSFTSTGLPVAGTQITITRP